MAAALDIEAGSASTLSSACEAESSLPPGLRVVFQDLTYTVKSALDKGQKLKLLDGVTAFAEPRQMTALMGPSGSGKTTLLDLLAGRKTTGTISGTIRFGSTAPSLAFLRRYTGYVEQFDTLIGSLTVHEMLMYTAELKRPISEPLSSKKEAVQHLISRLGLTTCADVKIGDSLSKGISGGQAKRTNIGIALIADPRVLFLDEPTSGLDSYSANEVMTLVQGLTREGTTVISTIHSPSAQAFSLFDRVLLLVGGRTAYFGPQGDAALQFAQRYWPGANKQHIECSLPELLVDIVTEADRHGEAQSLVDAYITSDLCKANTAQVSTYLTTTRTSASHRSNHALSFCSTKKSDINKNTSNSTHSTVTLTLAADKSDTPSRGSEGNGTAPVVKVMALASGTQPTRSQLSSIADDHARLEAQLNTRSSTATVWWFALWVLLKYRARVNCTNPAWVIPRLSGPFIFSIVILTLYLKTGNDFSEDNIVNITASLFMWCVLPSFGAVAYMPSIVLERALFYRERADGLYYVGTYFLAKLVEELVLAFVMSVALSSYVFYGVQYQGGFVLFWLTYFFTMSIGIAVGYWIAALSPNMDVANTALPAYVTTLLFFAGQLATFDSIPVYWQWYSRIDFVRYSWSAVMKNQFENEDPTFTKTGISVLSYFSMGSWSKWGDMTLLLAFFTVYALLAYITLSYLRHSKR